MITPLPSAPLATDSQAEFDTKAFAWVSALNGFTTEANDLAADANADATAAAAAAASATASYDAFDDRYLGSKSSDPSLDNDGNALLTGALYFNTASNIMKVYSGSAWLTAAANLAAPGPIGGTTPDTGAFTSITSTSASGILTRAAATQDGVELIGRAGGTASYKVSITPTTLTASRTFTLPDNSGTVLTTGAAVTVAQGGTGITSVPTNGQLLIGNGTGYTLAAITGTSNQITVTNGAGSITLSTPQSINTGASVQFGSFGVGTAASGTAGEIRATNNVTAYYSDDRLKTKLGKIENALDKIDQLNGFYYHANETAQKLGYKVKREVGVSAQEVQAVLPEIIAPAPIDENYMTIYYDRLVPLLIEAIKELRAEVKALKE